MTRSACDDKILRKNEGIAFDLRTKGIKMKKIAVLLICASAFVFANALYAVRANVYAYPAETPKSENFIVKIGGAECFAYRAEVADIAAFDFDGTGELNVEIKCLRGAKSAVVRPLSAGITPKIEDGTISFSISKPQYLSVEIDGDLERPLFLFASPEEKLNFKKGDPNVVWFDGGKTHNIGVSRKIKGGETVYIEGGAVVRGSFLVGERAAGSLQKSVKICGRGILTGEDMPVAAKFRKDQHALEKLPYSKLIECHRIVGLEIEGIISTGSPSWTTALFACDDVSIRNYKVVSGSARQHSDDGIDIVGSKNVLVENCFIRTKDDSITLKGAKLTRIKKIAYVEQNAPNTVENITVKDSVIWNHIHGNALEIGYETVCDEIRNIRFENIDIIHSLNNPGWMNPVETTFSIHNADRGTVRDVLYKNIRVEDPQVAIIYFAIMDSVYTVDKTRGKISNIRFEDIFITTKTPLIAIFKGRDAVSNISGITFKNFYINGKKIKSLQDLNAQTAFADGFVFE